MFDFSSKRALHKYGAQFGSSRGSIEVFKEGIVLRRGERDVAVRINYVQGLSQKGAEPFGKVGAELSFYDMFGNMETVSFQIRETDFKALKQDLGK